MATVKGPLFSIGASGTLAGAIVYSTWKGRPYVRQHAIPANPKSVLQVSTRSMMRFISQAWDALADAQKESWDARAAVTNISPFNAYVAYNMERWGRFVWPSWEDPATEADTAATLDTPVCTAGVRSVNIGFTVNPLQDNWGAAIFRKVDSAPGTTRSECIYIMLANVAQAYTYVDTGLTPGTDYYYDASPFSELGSIGVELSLGNAVPTS